MVAPTRDAPEQVGQQSELMEIQAVRRSGWAQSFTLMAVDICVLGMSAGASWALKFSMNPELAVEQYLQVLPFMLVISLLVYAVLELYPALGLGAAEELRRLTLGTTVVFVIGIALTFATKAGEEWSRQIVIVAWAISVVGIPIARAFVRRLFCRQAWWGIPCIVMGAGATGAQVVHLLQSRPWLGLRACAVLDDDASREGQQVLGVPILTPLNEQIAVMTKRGIRHGILAMPGLPADRLSRLLDKLGDHLRHIHIAPALPGSPDVIASTREFANTLVLEVRQNLLRVEVRFFKRFIDIISVSIGGIIICPLVLGIMMAVKLSSPGPIFYGQKRLGRGGREFTAWKFRSMVRDADEQLKVYLEAHPELREEWERDHKLKNDPRVTWIGSILRRTSLDELPQLWNVLKGEMSLVGPRPIVHAEVEKYGERYGLYQKVRPGLSGLWQVSGRNDTTYAERVALDCYYVRNWSVWLDIVILARTVRVVLLGKGAY